MAKSINTSAIVLKRINYKDADKILTLYTKNLGKITARAVGIRKIKSRKKSHLELFNEASCQLIESNNWYIITQAETLQTFPNLKESLEHAKLAYYVSEVFEKFVPQQEENSELYRFLVTTLETLDKSPSLSILNAFNVKLLKILGFYSDKQLFNINNEMNKYIMHLVGQKYVDIDLSKTNKVTVENTHLYLKSISEEILEQKIKTSIV